MSLRHGTPRSPVHSTCRDGCGHGVVVFVDEIGLLRQLENVDVQPGTDLSTSDNHRRVWQHLGPRLGWSRCHFPVDNNKHKRLEHQCAYTPAQRRLGGVPGRKEAVMSKGMFVELDSGENSERFRPAEHDGELLLLLCSSFSENVATSYGTKDAVEVDRVVVLDGPNEGQVYRGVRLFNTVLVQQLTTAAQQGKAAVGRMGAGAAGQNGRAPWKLMPATEEDQDKAGKWLEAQGGDASSSSASSSEGSKANPPF